MNAITTLVVNKSELWARAFFTMEGLSLKVNQKSCANNNFAC